MWVLESHRYVYWNRVRDRKFMQWDALLIWVWVYECLFFYLSECDIHLCSKQITLYYQEQNFSLIDNSSGISVFWKILCLLMLSPARYKNICKFGKTMFQYCSAPWHYLNQCLSVVNQTSGNHFWGNLDQNANISFTKCVGIFCLQNLMMAILSQLSCFKWDSSTQTV